MFSSKYGLIFISADNKLVKCSKDLVSELYSGKLVTAWQLGSRAIVELENGCYTSIRLSDDDDYENDYDEDWVLSNVRLEDVKGTDEYGDKVIVYHGSMPRVLGAYSGWLGDYVDINHYAKPVKAIHCNHNLFVKVTTDNVLIVDFDIQSKNVRVKFDKADQIKQVARLNNTVYLLLLDGTVYSFDRNASQDIQKVKLPELISKMVCSDKHAVFLSQEKNVYVDGKIIATKVDDIVCSFNLLVFVRGDCLVICSSKLVSDQRFVAFPDNVAKISISKSYVYVAISTGEIYKINHKSIDDMEYVDTCNYRVRVE